MSIPSVGGITSLDPAAGTGSAPGASNVTSQLSNPQMFLQLLVA